MSMVSLRLSQHFLVEKGQSLINVPSSSKLTNDTDSTWSDSSSFSDPLEFFGDLNDDNPFDKLTELNHQLVSLFQKGDEDDAVWFIEEFSSSEEMRRAKEQWQADEEEAKRLLSQLSTRGVVDQPQETTDESPESSNKQDSPATRKVSVFEEFLEAEFKEFSKSVDILTTDDEDDDSYSCSESSLMSSFWSEASIESLLETQDKDDEWGFCSKTPGFFAPDEEEEANGDLELSNDPEDYNANPFQAHRRPPLLTAAATPHSILPTTQQLLSSLQEENAAKEQTALGALDNVTEVSLAPQASITKDRLQETRDIEPSRQDTTDLAVIKHALLEMEAALNQNLTNVETTTSISLPADTPRPVTPHEDDPKAPLQTKAGPTTPRRTSKAEVFVGNRVSVFSKNMSFFARGAGSIAREVGSFAAVLGAAHMQHQSKIGPQAA